MSAKHQIRTKIVKIEESPLAIQLLGEIITNEGRFRAKELATTNSREGAAVQTDRSLILRRLVVTRDEDGRVVHIQPESNFSETTSIQGQGSEIFESNLIVSVSSTSDENQVKIRRELTPVWAF